MRDEQPRLENEGVAISIDEEMQPERTWMACCSRTSVAAAKYYSIFGLLSSVIVFSGCMLAAHPFDLEIRASFLPLLSGTLMLLVDPPKHD